MTKKMWLDAIRSWLLFLGVIAIVGTGAGGCVALLDHHPWGWLLLGLCAILLYLGFVLGEWMVGGSDER